MQNTICAVFQDDSAQTPWSENIVREAPYPPLAKTACHKGILAVFFVCLYNSLGTGGLSEFVDYR